MQSAERDHAGSASAGAPDDARASYRGTSGARLALGERGRGSRAWKCDDLEGEDLGETVEVRVAMEHSQAAVLGCGGGD
jgi:hypothetical protein